MIDKLIMITSKYAELEYGTILSVIRIHRNHKGYMATIAEKEPAHPVYVRFELCKEI